jgi:hypothetical protein
VVTSRKLRESRRKASRESRVSGKHGRQFGGCRNPGLESTPGSASRFEPAGISMAFATLRVQTVTSCEAAQMNGDAVQPGPRHRDLNASLKFPDARETTDVRVVFRNHHQRGDQGKRKRWAAPRSGTAGQTGENRGGKRNARPRV